MTEKYHAWDMQNTAGDRDDEPQRIEDRCPSCGSQTLFIGKGGWLTCSLIGCKNPCVSDAIKAESDQLRLALQEAEYNNSEAATAIEGFGNRLADALTALQESQQEVERLQKEVSEWRLTVKANLGQQISEQQAVIQELAEALRIYIDWVGGFHDDDCSMDDTCDCSGKERNDKINKAYEAAAPWLRKEED